MECCLKIYGIKGLGDLSENLDHHRRREPDWRRIHNFRYLNACSYQPLLAGQSISSSEAHEPKFIALLIRNCSAYLADGYSVNFDLAGNRT